MIGRTNGGGGNGVSSHNALLVVYAPLGSIVTINKDGISKTSRKDIALSDRPTIGMHLFSIGNSQFGTWTVTATRDADTNSTTVTINTVRRYELYIGYHVPIDLYQEVEYLQGNTPYINTNVSMGGFACDIECEIVSLLNTGCEIVGTVAAEGARNYFSVLYGDYQLGLGDSYPTYGAATLNVKHTVSFSTIYGSESLIIDGVNKNVATSLGNNKRGNYALKLFRVSGNNIGTLRIYSCSIYSNAAKTTKVFEFVPCYRRSDSVAGMWDNVSKQFFTNAGSGTFVVGADVG